MLRTPFFPPSLKTDDTSFRVSEDANHGRDWMEAGKAVSILEASGFSHPAIMPDFLTIKIADSPSREHRFSCCFYPLAGTKTQYAINVKRFVNVTQVPRHRA